MTDLWIARDKCGELWVYNNKPHKITDRWNARADVLCISEHFFPNIKWEQLEPIRIVIRPAHIQDKEQLWMARNKRGSLCIYSKKPIYDSLQDLWYDKTSYNFIRIDNDLFPGLFWEQGPMEITFCFIRFTVKDDRRK